MFGKIQMEDLRELVIEANSTSYAESFYFYADNA